VLAEHLSHDLPYKLSSDDIFLTAGGTQAIEVIISVLSQPGTNILLPKPGYPNYEARAAFNNLEVRRFNLIPEKGWEVDIDSLEAIADENTTAMVLINPNNPCGSVYTYQHLAKVLCVHIHGCFSFSFLNLLYRVPGLICVLVIKDIIVLLKSHLGCRSSQEAWNIGHRR
jgi:aspartate/methionine/tyrosine aminotransferase